MRTAWFDIVSGSRTGAKAAAARAVLRALSIPFGAAVSGRKWLYGKGALRTKRASIPVVSVGGITAGGAGKTTLVEYVARGLVDRGRRPSVVMRGYGAGYGGSCDEARILRANLGEEVPVVEDPDRLRGTEAAARRHGSEVAVLDDGFQHVRLERDLDVVAVDATSPFGFGKLLPAGCLREKPEALARADVIVITRSDLPPGEEVGGVRERLRELAPGALVAKAVFAPSRLENLNGAEGPPFEKLKGAPVAAFCGIGNPHAFGITVRRLGGELVFARRFPDHHPYTLDELNGLARAAEAREAGFVLTTQKDAARIPRDAWPAKAPPLYVLRCEFAFIDGEAAFWDLVEFTLDRALADRSKESRGDAASEDSKEDRP